MPPEQARQTNPLNVAAYQRRAAACNRCGRPIVFVRNVVAAAKGTETYIPVDPVPDPEGSVCAFRDQAGRRWSGLHGWPISAEHPHDPRGRIYMPHPAICPVRPGPAGTRPHQRTEPQLPLEFDDEDEYEEYRQQLGITESEEMGE